MCAERSREAITYVLILLDVRPQREKPHSIHACQMRFAIYVDLYNTSVQFPGSKVILHQQFLKIYLGICLSHKIWVSELRLASYRLASRLKLPELPSVARNIPTYSQISISHQLRVASPRCARSANYVFWQVESEFWLAWRGFNWPS